MINPGGYALQDTILKERIREVVKEYGITTIVETGVNEGKSTIELAEMVEKVVAIDNSPECLESTANLIREKGQNNIALFLGNSPVLLFNLRFFLPDKTLYFLDAHWDTYWPLLDEIRALKQGSGIILLHDIVVPNCPELGYDSYDVLMGRVKLKSLILDVPVLDPNSDYWADIYKSQPLDYAYVKDELTLWSPTHRLEYNNKSAGTDKPRGVAFVFPS